MSNKIVRSICFFDPILDNTTPEKMAACIKALEVKNYLVQTKRVCTLSKDFAAVSRSYPEDFHLSLGTISLELAWEKINDFVAAKNVYFNIELADREINERTVEFLLEVIKLNPAKTFNFAFVFNNAHSSPFFPSASFERQGFAIGLQTTDLAQDSQSLQEWLEQNRACWTEIHDLFLHQNAFLGIDSSIAPLNEGVSSLVHLIKNFGYDFNSSFTTDIWTTITEFIKNNNPKPVGLCGLMFPCLEDFELAREYEAGNFSIERNIFASLHSGLGIDTYPMGVDENPHRIIDILKTLKALSNKYKKPLSARFISDGKTKIGERSDFHNEYLYDVAIRKL